MSFNLEKWNAIVRPQNKKAKVKSWIRIHFRNTIRIKNWVSLYLHCVKRERKFNNSFLQYWFYYK